VDTPRFLRSVLSNDVIMYSTFRAQATSRHTNKKVLKKKRYFEVTTEKCEKGQNMVSFFFPCKQVNK
jgi:hypothetical protein